MVRVPVLDSEYLIRESPDQLADGDGGFYTHQLDHEMHIIWLAPDLHRSDRDSVLAAAVAQAWQERLSAACCHWLRSNHLAIQAPAPKAPTAARRAGAV